MHYITTKKTIFQLIILIMFQLLLPETELFSQVWGISSKSSVALNAEAFAETKVSASEDSLHPTGKPGELRGYAFAIKKNAIIWCPLSGSSFSNVLIQGIGTPTLLISWYSVASASYRCESNEPYYAYGMGDLLAELGLIVTGTALGNSTTVHTKWSQFTYSSFSPEAVNEDSAMVENSALLLDSGPLINPPAFNLPNLKGVRMLRDQIGSFAVSAGDTLILEIEGSTFASIHEPGKLDLRTYLIKDREQASFVGEMTLSLDPIPEFPMWNTLVKFSLDIGSDTELSDPNKDGDEVFDPGDMYLSTIPILPTGGDDGILDDMTIFSVDPLPDPPDGPPPLTGAPVGTAQNADALAHLYFDLDGYDGQDFSLLQHTYGPQISSIQAFTSQTVYTTKSILISFDDDGGAHYTGDSFQTEVPITNPSFYGSTSTDDEILGVIAFPTSGTLHNLAACYPYIDETSVNINLGPNPDSLNMEYNDDVDALDKIYSGLPYDFHYFSVDHEAALIDSGSGLTLDPGAIYMSDAGGGYSKVIDPVTHLGIPAGTDVDAFEFAWLWDGNAGYNALALLFSVDDYDWLVSTDVSGGMNPNMIYFSFLNGTYDSLFINPLCDDIDAITTEWSQPFQYNPGSPVAQEGYDLQPAGYTLEQNYPNPFNSGTRISFAIPREDRVKISIYNTLGEKVIKLVDRIYQAGNHQLVWDGTDNMGEQVQSGIFIIRMEAGNMSSSRTCLLLK